MHALNTPGGLLRNHPVLWMALPLMVGIAAGDVLYAHLSFHTWPLLLGAVMACLGATASALVHPGPSARRPALFGLFVLLFFFFTGCALLVADRDRTAVRWPALHDVTTRAVIVETPRAGQRSVTATVSLADGPWRHRHVRLTLPTRGDDRPGRLRVGQTLLVRTRIEAPHNFAGSTSTFDYAAYLRRQGIAGQAYCPPWRWVNLSVPGDERGLRPEKLSQRQKFLTQRQNFLSQRQDEQGLHLLPPGERLRVKAIALRDRMAERYAPHLTGSELGVVAAMTLNDNRHLDRDVRDVYAQTGASHVLSLSGLHLTILFSLVLTGVLRRCWHPALRLAVGIAMLLGLWAFALLAGLPVALVRATVMYSVLVVSELLQRGYSAVNSLATAALVILLVWPQALMDVSFQLSFLSMAALLLLLPLLTPRGHSLAGRLLTTWVTVPVSAQVAVLPLVAYYFHTVAAYFLVANAVAVPASFVILCAALAFFLLPFEGVQTLLGHVLDITTHTMNTLLAAIAQWPGAAIHYAPSPTGVALTYGGLVLTVAALATRRRAYVYALTVCFTLAVCAELYAHSPAAKF